MTMAVWPRLTTSTHKPSHRFPWSRTGGQTVSSRSVEPESLAVETTASEATGTSTPSAQWGLFTLFPSLNGGTYSCQKTHAPWRLRSTKGAPLPQTGKPTTTVIWEPTVYNAITHLEFVKAAKIAKRNLVSCAKFAASPSTWVSTIVNTVKSLATSVYDTLAGTVESVMPAEDPRLTAARYWTQDSTDKALSTKQRALNVFDVFDRDAGKVSRRYTFDRSGPAVVEHNPPRWSTVCPQS